MGFVMDSIWWMKAMISPEEQQSQILKLDWEVEFIKLQQVAADFNT